MYIFPTGVRSPISKLPCGLPTSSPGFSAARARSSAAVEALALEEFKLGHLSRAEMRRLLGFGTRAKLDEFLAAHHVFASYTLDDLERERRDLQRLGF